MIPQIEPWIDENEFLQVEEVLKSGWLVEGPRTEEFERLFAALTGCRHALAVNNATVALYICLRSLGVGEGHEVILPDFTFIATLNAVTWAGAKPVLVDIDERTLNIDPQEVRKAITAHTRAVIPVHLYGQPADMESIMSIARAHDLLVIEDASESVGSRFQDRPVGSWGQVGCFSFYGNKTVTTGQGGMITTDDERIWRGCVALKNHGRQERGTFVHQQVGYNFAFTDLQAAIGLAQMSKLEEILRRKQRNDDLYRKLLADVEAVQIPSGDPRSQAIPWFTNILVDDPQSLESHLAAAGIGSRRLFYPLHRQPCYRGWFEDRYPVTDRTYARGLSLPSSVTLTTEQIEQVCGQLRIFFGIDEKP